MADAAPTVEREGPKNKSAFKALHAQVDAIEIEFGSRLDWQELQRPRDAGSGTSFHGGYRSPQDQ